MSDYILVTHWTGGDVFPFIRLGKMLKKEGHKVTILTHCVFEEKAKAAGLEFVAVDNQEEYDAMNRDMPMLTDPIGRKEDYILFHKRYHGKEKLLREVKLIEGICNPDSIIIARFRSSISGMLVAEKNHLNYASMILAPNFFSHMELHDQLFGEAFCEEINKARGELELPPITGWKDWLYSPKTILCAWPDWYAQRDETWPECAIPIGFLKESENNGEPETEPEITDFLNEAKKMHKKTAIITGGTSRLVREDFYQTAIESSALADVYTIAVTPFDDYIPEKIPDTVMCVHYAPVRSLMKEVDLVIHHGGMSTINEAIDAEVSQIIMPNLVDGPDNADRLEALGIATKFPHKLWNPEQIAQSIQDQFNDKKVELRQRYKEINQKTYDAKLWAQALLQSEPYVLPEQKKPSANVGENDSAKKQISREMLIKIMRQKQAMKSI